LIGATGDNRIQLAPLRGGVPPVGGGSGSPIQVQQQQVVPPPPPPQQVQGYYQAVQPVVQQQQHQVQQVHGRSGSRDEYRDHGRSEDRNGNAGRELSAGREDARKKNPLSIGSIISDDVSR
jgi:hypothetical protein